MQLSDTRSVIGAQPSGCRIVREDERSLQNSGRHSQFPHSCSLKAALQWGPNSAPHGSVKKMRLGLASLVAVATLLWSPLAPAAGGTLLDQFRVGPMAGVDDIIFAARRVNETDGHWYANIGYYAHDPNRKARRRFGQRHGVQDQRRWHRPAPAHRRPLRRYRAHLPAQRRHRLRLHPLQALGQLLAHAGRHPVPLRRPRPKHPSPLQQQRPRQHPLAAGRRSPPLHALGIRGSQPGPLPSSLGRQSRRHRPDDLVRQPPPRHRDD